MKKTLLSLLLILSLMLGLSGSALAVVDASDEFYVNDTAGVLSQETKEMILSYNGDLEYYCKGAQIVVVTVDYLDGMYSDEYAGALFENYGVGSATYNNGMLLLLAVGENKAWLTVGKGITDAFTDDMVEEYFNDYFWDAFDAGDYDEAVSTMFHELAWWFADYYNVSERADTSGSTAANPGYEYTRSNYGSSAAGSGLGLLSWIGYFIFRLIALVFTFMPIILILLIFILNDRARYRAYYRYMGLPIPVYHPWFIFSAMPYRTWRGPHDRGGPRGPGGFGGGGFWGGGSGFGGGGSFGGGGGFGGSSGGFGGGFGGGGHMGGGFGGGGGMGGGGGRR